MLANVKKENKKTNSQTNSCNNIQLLNWIINAEHKNKMFFNLKYISELLFQNNNSSGILTIYLNK